MHHSKNIKLCGIQLIVTRIVKKQENMTPNLESLINRKRCRKESDDKNSIHWDFPGGAVVKNPPVNAGDTGLIPGLGRSHMLQSN